MKQNPRIKATIYMAWWWPFYTAGVIGMCRLTGQLPDEKRFGQWFARAARARFTYAPRAEDA